jgi:hypothetical protein
MLDYTGSYFRICYQIVKLINKSEILRTSTPNEIDEKVPYSAEQKEYFDIFRATLTKHEIEAFFFNCLSEYGNKKFKIYIEKYGLFEPLPIDLYRSGEKIHRLTRYAYQYNSIIFEKNTDWGEYYIDIRNIKLNININDLINLFKIFLELEIIKHSQLFYKLRRDKNNPLISGASYYFNNNIKFNKLTDILSEENFNRIEDSYESYYKKITNQINEETNNIKNYDELINDLKIIFKEKNKEVDINEVIIIDNPWDMRYSIAQLEDSKLKSKKNKKINENLLIKYNSNKKILQNHEYTLTILTLIKYGIDYTEYNTYMNLHSTIENPTQQS